MQYAVRKNPVISYAGLKTYTNIVQFLRRNTTKIAFEVKTLAFLHACFACAHFGHFKLIILKRGLLAIEKSKKYLAQKKLTLARMTVPLIATNYIICFSVCKRKRQTCCFCC